MRLYDIAFYHHHRERCFRPHYHCNPYWDDCYYPRYDYGYGYGYGYGYIYENPYYW